ncbi:torsin-1A-interacting protein 2-like isoform X2 [Cyprinodon tularosa]|uniref:torsin-1A-interacting protein 2-like isoform X2 n=1 Tax=Cyprinodon tularosa TaxID=77115 RepID=UPI0018E23610|nr:torsin-1A-interacting protein 2-like isoform X2 [Cyprinodon tularosa]
MEGEQKADCQQPDGNAETSVKPTGEDVTEQNPSTSQTLGSEREEVVNDIKVGMNEGSAATDGTNSNKEEESKPAEGSLKTDVHNNDEADDKQGDFRGEAPETEKPEDKMPDKYPSKTTPADGESPKTLDNEETPGDEDLAKGDSLLTMDKNSCQQAIEERQDNSTGDSLKQEVSTVCSGLKSQEDPSKEEKEEENELIKKDVKTICSAATQADPAQDTGALGDVDLAKGDSLLTMDKNSCQSVIDESQDNSTGDLLKEEESTDGRRTSHMSQEEPGRNADIETIGPITQAEPSADTGTIGGGLKLLMSVALVSLVAILVQHLLQPKPTIQKKDLPKVDIFLKQMEKVKTRFPNQRAELWSRSVIHLKRHLQTSQPTEPVSLILTSGFRAENTMRCLAQDVASAFSAALNASVLHIDGASTASQDSDQVKLDIDRKLQGAFEGDKPVAVIHRLEELPPGSTLIFYRYCDHETAAYKNTLLIFTVLLGEEEEIPAEMRLSIVEEMVDDYLKKRFLSHGQPVSFDRMDLNKYGGLWSRISHLILPVVVEERIEHKGC